MTKAKETEKSNPQNGRLNRLCKYDIINNHRFSMSGPCIPLRELKKKK